MDELPPDVVEMINTQIGNFNRQIGLRFVEVERDRFVAELEVKDTLLQPYGLVHGGVFSAMIETVCSTGAAVSVFDEGRSVVGLENSTSFLRAVRGGRLRCVATPAFQGRRSQVWEGRIHDDEGRTVAAGRVRLLVLEPGSSVGRADTR